MATITVKSKIIVRNDTDANWVSANPVLLKGRILYRQTLPQIRRWLDEMERPPQIRRTIRYHSEHGAFGWKPTYLRGGDILDRPFCILSRNLHIDPTGERQPRVAPTHHGRGTRSKRGDAGKGFCKGKRSRCQDRICR